MAAVLKARAGGGGMTWRLGRSLAAAAVLACGLAAARPALSAEAVEVGAHPAGLGPREPASAAAWAALGRLRFEAGFLLRSADPRFGGLSGLLVAPDGGRLTAVSDRATIWT